MRKFSLMIAAMLCMLLNTMAQTKTLTGKVTDDKGAAIPNVSVIVKGTTTGTTTATDGTYSISIPDNGKVLEFSSLNFETASFNIGTKQTISPSLQPTSKELEGVVITGINRVKRSQFAGAASKIDEKTLKNVPVGSFDQILQGNAPGVTLLTGSGQPGEASTVIIRGSSSILGGSAPFYVVDGIPVEEGTFQNMNPNDFASVDILRDAAATSLYGSRASAGVIAVTTKKGTAGKMRIGYSGQFGVKREPDFAFSPMNTTQLLQNQHDYGRTLSNLNVNPASDPVNTNPNIPGWFYSSDNPRFSTLSPDSQSRVRGQLDSISKINTNWNDAIFRQGNFSNHQITLSGGSGNTRLYSSLGFYNEEGTTLRTDMRRITWNTNVDYNDDKLSYTLSTNIGFSRGTFSRVPILTPAILLHHQPLPFRIIS